MKTPRIKANLDMPDGTSSPVAINPERLSEVAKRIQRARELARQLEPWNPDFDYKKFKDEQDDDMFAKYFHPKE